MRAPRVVAKGVDLVAQNILRIAREHRVPVFESPKLARALYRSTDLNREIPAGLYVAVAQVLSYVFRIRTMNPTLAARLAPSGARSSAMSTRTHEHAQRRPRPFASWRATVSACRFW